MTLVIPNNHNEEEKVIHNNRGYDFVRNCFYVNNTIHLYKDGEPVLSLEGKPYFYKKGKRFRTFEEYYLYLQGDIYSNACYYGWIPNSDLIEKYALIMNRLRRESLCNDVIDNHTWRPQSENTICKLQLQKKYDRKKDCFLVRQIWLDQNNTILHTQEYSFTLFVDFYFFLCGNLNGTDFSMMPSAFFSRLKNTDINLSGIIEPIPLDKSIDAKEFEISLLNEEKSVDYLECIRDTEGELIRDPYLGSYYQYSGNQILYISDLHLDNMINKAKCKSLGDVCNLMERIGKRLEESYHSFVSFASEGNVCVVIAGDITASPLLFKLFTNMKYDFWKKAVIILGNHELWAFAGLDVDNIVYEYKKLSPIPILQNEILVFSDSVKDENISSGVYVNYEIQHISYSVAMSMSPESLSYYFSSARMVMLAGIGFSGCNQEFNADNGLYRFTLTREQEINESKKFNAIYQHFILSTKSIKDRIIVVATHMPIENWSENPLYEDGIIYISGHTHKNYFYDDGLQRIYADNQNGYHGNNPSFKCIYSDDLYDPFISYLDGVYEISKAEYILFYRAKKIGMQLNRDFRTIYMLKKKGYYCFLARLATGKLSVLNGGKGKSSDVMNPDYFYENMDMVIETVSNPLNEYTKYQRNASDAIKSIGGTGRIHGCIVDIDFFNHLFVNPFDLSITGYFATNMVEKWIYQSIEEMLKERAPALYYNYINLLKSNSMNALTQSKSNINIEEKNATPYLETIIYKASREISKMQKLHSNILCVWPTTLPNISEGLFATDKLKYNLLTDKTQQTLS